MSVSIVKSSKSLKAVSDPTRLAVIELLMEKDTFVSAFIENLKIEPTLLSHHLSILRNEGIVLANRIGKTVLYRLNPEVKIKGKQVGLKLDNCKILFSDEIIESDNSKKVVAKTASKSVKKVDKKTTKKSK
jgi:DNA-binding transcriptional ArsR family regulator